MEWIKVDFEDAPHNITIIAYCNDGTVFPADVSDEGIYDMEAGCYLPPHQHITHWMYFPEPPKD